MLTAISGTPLTISYGNPVGLPAAIAPSQTGVINPTPSITSLSPSTGTTAATAFTMTVNGSNFVPGSRVYYGGRGRATTYVSPTQLTANILGVDIATGGTAIVFVYNPPQGGGASSSVEFPVINPTPVVSSINPSIVTAGGSYFTLTLNGSEFLSNSTITFNGAPQQTTFVSSTELQTIVIGTQIASPGTIQVGATTPAIGGVGGGNSGTLPLTVNSAGSPPVINQLAPGSATAGGPAFTLFITGTNFTSTASATLGLTPLSVTSANTTQILASVPASAITTAGAQPVVVTTAGGASAPVTFYIENPPPTAGGVTPPVVPAGSAALTLNISGSGFAMGSTVLVNGASRVTTFVSSTLLQVTLLPADISHGGTLVITVSTPGPGGGVSAPITLAVADYAVSAGSSTSSISAGQIANYTLTIAPSNGAYTNPVTFTASGLPAGAAASFSPSATVTPGGTATNVTLSISTTARAIIPSDRVPPSQSPQWPVSGIILMELAGMALIYAGISLSPSQSLVRRLAPKFLLAIVLMTAAGLVACSSGSGGSGSTPGGGSVTGTPSGTYSVVVTATSGADVHTTTVTLTVQ